MGTARLVAARRGLAGLSSYSTMFNPSRDQVRQFFADAWRKHRSREILTPLETIALDWIMQHPEYHADLEHPDALSRDFAVEEGRTNPFLHLSMHLAIAEQVSVDHPRGIRAAHDATAASTDPHHAAHEIMECLGQVVWESQRLGTPLDSDAYIDLIRRRIGTGLPGV